MSHLGIVGAGWAGLATAVAAVEAGHSVSLLELAAQPGGRARRLDRPGATGPAELAEHPGVALDNGQHLLIGAYGATLDLMRRVGLDPAELLLRQPLALLDPQGRGLDLPPGGHALALLRGLLHAPGWRPADRIALALWMGRRALGGFRAAPQRSVADLARGLPPRIRQGLIEPLCVAALNTPASAASAAVFLRVLRDALLGPRGASDLLLPRVDLGALLPDAAWAWLQARGARLHRRCHVQTLSARSGGGWHLHSPALQLECDAVVLATGPRQAAALVAGLAPGWAATARALPHQALATVLLHSPGPPLGRPLLLLDEGPQAPAQALFDLGQLRDPRREPGAAGLWAAVVSAADPWLARGLPTLGEAVRLQLAAQAGPLLPSDTGRRVLRVLSDKRATFACHPSVQRPPAAIAPGLAAAGDHVAGPYPATLEGAVRSAADALAAALRPGPPPARPLWRA